MPSEQIITPLTSKQGNPSYAYFLSLSIENLRCFGRSQTLNLSKKSNIPARWTILLGNNGSGKTTALQALASFEPARSTLNSELITPRFWMRQESQGSVWAPRLDGQYRLDLRYSTDATLESAGAEKASWIHGAGSTMTWTTLLPPAVLYGYGASRHLSKSQLSEKEADDATSTLFRDDANLRNAEEWLLRLDYSASVASDIQGQQRLRRDQVVALLKEILPEVDNIRFTKPTAEQTIPTIEFSTPYGWVDLWRLGHGYRTLIAWMVDFASRMVERYPISPNPLAEPAILLIDEIDLHMHPGWQRVLLSHLAKLFPRTQFIASAHSPLIILAAEDANIALFRRESDQVIIDNDVERIRNWRVDQILTSSLFGLHSARSPDLDPMLERRKQLLGKTALTVAEDKELQELETRIGTLPGGDTSAEALKMMRLTEETHDLIKKYGG